MLTKMRALTIIFIVFLSVLSFATEIDYYWRNYNGEVPEDALSAGVDASGNPIYIGQAFFQDAGVLPGTLRAGSSNLKATAAWRLYQTDKFVRILCTRHGLNFRWEHINKHSDITALTDVHIVDGGWEYGTVLYVGRAQHEGNLEIGKIYNSGPYKGLAFPNKGTTETDYTSFELLVYDPAIKIVVKSPNVDFRIG